MNRGSSDQVRAIAKEKYVKPALDSGKTRFAVAVKDLWEDLVALGFPPANVPQVCTALRKKEFLRENGLEIEGIDGPPSKQSTTVVVRYRVSGIESRAQSMERASENIPVVADSETPEQWALRVTDKIRGLLKNEIAEMGGAEAFIRWVRSNDEDEAA
jgi:hypothetical protein